ncbi:MAG: hypothetical protein ACKVUS_04210, partial [Saprospiraceae bacterium]
RKRKDKPIEDVRSAALNFLLGLARQAHCAARKIGERSTFAAWRSFSTARAVQSPAFPLIFVLKNDRMYLVPLNHDRYFRKVFSELRIAKRFLEDVFDTSIESIELLPTRHNITNESVGVEFDFRCKIDGKYVIIDMQQWYNTDIVKRFYLYHCLNTALQLEKMPMKALLLHQMVEKATKKEIRDYSQLEPVVTLIWLADDSLKTTDDFLSFSLTPETLSEFIREDGLWENEDVADLMKRRAEVLAQMDSRVKELDFLPKNRLVFALQPNIVKKAKFRRYAAWFELAEKSKNRDNVEADFKQFAKDEIFVEIMRRLSMREMEAEDFEYIDNYEIFSEQFKLLETSLFQEGRHEGWHMGIEEGIKVGKEEGEKETKIKTAEKCLLRGMSLEETAEIVELPIEAVQGIAQRLGLLEK